MGKPNTNDKLGPLLEQMLALVGQYLTVPVALLHRVPGNAVSWDNCCEGGGQAWIRIVSLVGAPALDKAAKHPCTQMYQARLAIGHLRCAHTIDDEGNFPTVEDLLADERATDRDRNDILRAIVCGMGDDLSTLRIEQWLPSPNLGGCVGGEWTFTANVDLCSGC